MSVGFLGPPAVLQSGKLRTTAAKSLITVQNERNPLPFTFYTNIIGPAKKGRKTQFPFPIFALTCNRASDFKNTSRHMQGVLVTSLTE
jgi:hypothetical protein